jgi:hypothetical protein
MATLYRTRRGARCEVRGATCEARGETSRANGRATDTDRHGMRPSGMRHGMTTAAAISVMLITAGAAHAQSIYVFGGTSQTWRKPGWTQQSIDDHGPDTTPTPSVVAGAGWWVTPRLGIEGSIEFQRRQTLSWRYGYMANQDMSTTDFDTPILGHVRLAALRAQQVSIDLLIGGGVTWHGTRSFVVRECSRTFPVTCVTLDPPADADTYGTWEWALSTGVDVPIRLGDHVRLSPTARVLYALRRDYLTATDFRGPASGPGLMPSIGLTLRWTPR